MKRSEPEPEDSESGEYGTDTYRVDFEVMIRAGGSRRIIMPIQVTGAPNSEDCLYLNVYAPAVTPPAGEIVIANSNHR